jgi:hypothetical protein
MPTEVVVELESDDRRLISELLETNEISESILIRRKSLLLRETVSIPEVVEIVIEISKEVSLEFAVGVLAAWIYDKMKDRRKSRVTIGDTEIPKDRELIKKRLMENVREVEYYLAEFQLPEFPEEELQRAARTLSYRPIVFDDQQLPYPANTTLFSDYIDGLVKVEALVSDKNVIKLYEDEKPLHAKPEIERPLSRLLFSRLIVSSKVGSSSKEWIVLKKLPTR